VGNTGVLSGDYYAFTASGGLVLEQSFEEIAALTQDGSFSQVDVTDVIQILYDVRKANSKIGITKDASNELITATTFDAVNQTFSTDKLVITADEIIDDLSANGAGNIVSVGKCETLFTQILRITFILISDILVDLHLSLTAPLRSISVVIFQRKLYSI
jgi:hypothetical protein